MQRRLVIIKPFGDTFVSSVQGVPLSSTDFRGIKPGVFDTHVVCLRRKEKKVFRPATQLRQVASHTHFSFIDIYKVIGSRAKADLFAMFQGMDAMF